MEGLNNINKAIQYIEENLENTIDLKLAAQKALLSEYHLSRLFTQLFGISLSEYIRRRRLTLAAYDLQNHSVRVIDVALKFGYESADAFSRAFKKLHGITPSEAKGKGMKLVAFPKISVNILIAGESGIDYRIENTDVDILVYGKSFRIKAEKELNEIPKAWQSLTKDDALEHISNRIPSDITYLNGLLGIYYGDRADKAYGEYDYFIGGRAAKQDISLMQLNIPKGRWLVFTNLTDARRKLFSEWIPTLGYILDNRPYIECIFSPYNPTDNELWVPIQ